MKNIALTRGTTNAFADLGFPDAGERQTKIPLAFAINELLKSSRRQSTRGG